MEHNHNAANTEGAATAAVGATAGDLLKQAREAADLTREAVAERLNLLPAQVIALEQNDFKRFPGETFVKGHLRSYARLLNLDCGDVLRAYQSSGAVPPPAAAIAEPSFNWRPIRLTRKASHWRRYSGLAAALAVIVALWAWQQHRDRSSQVLSLTAATSDTLGGIDSALNSEAENALMDSVQLLPTTQAPAPAPARTETTAQTDQAATAAAPAASEAQADRLSLRFSADCWIEIKDRDNRVLVATLKHADEQLQIEGRGPFKVLLGYAPGVVMAYNGAPVKVDVAEGSRSTRLIVGSS